jgi:hypothetical protein
MPEFFSNIWEGYKTLHWFWWALPGWILAVLLVLFTTINSISSETVKIRLTAIGISIVSYWYGGYIVASLFWLAIICFIGGFCYFFGKYIITPMWKCVVWLLLPEDWKFPKTIIQLLTKAIKTILPKKPAN